MPDGLLAARHRRSNGLPESVQNYVCRLSNSRGALFSRARMPSPRLSLGQASEILVTQFGPHLGESLPEPVAVALPCAARRSKPHDHFGVAFSVSKTSTVTSASSRLSNTSRRASPTEHDEFNALIDLFQLGPARSDRAAARVLLAFTRTLICVACAEIPVCLCCCRARSVPADPKRRRRRGIQPRGRPSRARLSSAHPRWPATNNFAQGVYWCVRESEMDCVGDVRSRNRTKFPISGDKRFRRTL